MGAEGTLPFIFFQEKDQTYREKMYIRTHIDLFLGSLVVVVVVSLFYLEHTVFSHIHIEVTLCK